MNAIRKGVCFLAGLCTFVLWVWVLIGTISGEVTTAQVEWLVFCFAVYFLLDTRIRFDDLEKRMGIQEARDYEIIFSVSSLTCKPNLPKLEPKPETEEGNKTT